MTKLRSRKFGVAAILVAVMLGIILLVVPSIAADNGAIVINPYGDECTYIDPALDPPDIVTSGEARAVVTQSSNFNVSYKCEDITTNPGPAVIYTFEDNPLKERGINVVCNVPWDWDQDGQIDGEFPSIDWKQTVSSSGNVSLVCHLNL